MVVTCPVDDVPFMSLSLVAHDHVSRAGQDLRGVSAGASVLSGYV